MRSRHCRQRRRSDQSGERQRPAGGSDQQLRLKSQRVVEPPPLRRHRIQRGGHVRPPAGHDHRTPPGAERHLRCRSETPPIGITNPAGRTHIDQPHPVTGDDQEVRDMRRPPVGEGEPQLERLRQQVDNAQKVERDQDLLLGQALEPMVAAGADHELQAGPMPLPRPPAEPPYRRAPGHRPTRRILDRDDHRRRSDLPSHRPPTPPTRRQPQLRPRAGRDRLVAGEVIEPASIRGNPALTPNNTIRHIPMSTDPCASCPVPRSRTPRGKNWLCPRTGSGLHSVVNRSSGGVGTAASAPVPIRQVRAQRSVREPRIHTAASR